MEKTSSPLAGANKSASTKERCFTMTTFNRCPNCGHKPGRGFMGEIFTIYECKGKTREGKPCGTHYCYKCGGDRCPNCGSRERREAGKCYAR
jgi:hypothetical protein